MYIELEKGVVANITRIVPTTFYFYGINYSIYNAVRVIRRIEALQELFKHLFLSPFAI